MAEYLEGLFKGSPDHKATSNGPNAVMIEPINDTDDSIQRFQPVVREAIARADEVGFEIRPRRSSSDGLGRYNAAAIIATQAPPRSADFSVDRINQLPQRNSNAVPPTWEVVKPAGADGDGGLMPPFEQHATLEGSPPDGGSQIRVYRTTEPQSRGSSEDTAPQGTMIHGAQVLPPPEQQATLEHLRDNELQTRNRSAADDDSLDDGGTDDDPVDEDPDDEDPDDATSIPNRREAQRYAQLLVGVLQDALDYNPQRHHNQPPPELRLSGDPEYLDELRNLVAELRRLNGLLSATIVPKTEATAQAGVIARKFDRFLDSYIDAMGKGAACLTIGVVAALLSRTGVGAELIDHIWGHIRIPD